MFFPKDNYSTSILNWEFPIREEPVYAGMYWKVYWQASTILQFCEIVCWNNTYIEAEKLRKEVQIAKIKILDLLPFYSTSHTLREENKLLRNVFYNCRNSYYLWMAAVDIVDSKVQMGKPGILQCSKLSVAVPISFIFHLLCNTNVKTFLASRLVLSLFRGM